jgi:hypothetical protein
LVITSHIGSSATLFQSSRRRRENTDLKKRAECAKTIPPFTFFEAQFHATLCDQQPVAALCRLAILWIELAWKIMIRTHNKLFCIVLLWLISATGSRASDVRPIWTIDLKPLGYPVLAPPAQAVIRIKFWRQYLQIESTLITCGKCGPGFTTTTSPGPTLIFDTISGRQIPLNVLAASWKASSTLKDCPRNSKGACKDPFALPPDAVVPLANWDGMTLSRGVGQTLYLEEFGHKKVLRSGNYFESAGFLAPDRILIQEPFAHKSGCALCNVHYLVVDKTGAVKYQIDPYDWGYMALNPAAARFAVIDNECSKARKVFSAVFSGFSDDVFEEDTGRAKVYSTDDGSKLLEYQWRLKNSEHRAEGMAALSDDGSTFALVAGVRLLIFRVPSPGK